MNTDIRHIVRGVYALQKLRIQIGNRIVANFKVKLGQEPGTPEANMEADKRAFLKELRMVYKRITDGLAGTASATGFEGEGVISSYAEYCLAEQYVRILEMEERQFVYLADIVKQHPLWEAFFKDVKGIGPTIAGVILSEVNIHEAHYPSSLWRYAGLDVGPDGRGRGRYSEHLVDRVYVDAAGKVKMRKSITYNPFLKTKLMGVLAPSFLKHRGKYRTMYDNYKHRLEYRVMTKAHRHWSAMRYAVKMFLVDLYVVWRRLEGLDVSKTYQEEKLGKTHRE